MIAVHYTYGMNKETGGVARQFVLGVVQSAEGLPLMHTVHPDNVSETKTLQGMLQALTPHRYQKSQSILVRISQIHRTLTGTDLFPTNFSGGKYR